MVDEKVRLEQQVESLSSKLAKKEARLRGSMDALAQASYKLRSSFAAEVSGGGWHVLAREAGGEGAGGEGAFAQASYKLRSSFAAEVGLTLLG